MSYHSFKIQAPKHIVHTNKHIVYRQVIFIKAYCNTYPRIKPGQIIHSGTTCREFKPESDVAIVNKLKAFVF